MYTPLNYDQLNLQAGYYNPSVIKPYNNEAFRFWERSLFQRACSALDFTLPEEWQGSVRDFFFYVLFQNGFLPIFKLDNMGLVFNHGTLRGQDFYYQPTHALIANPALPYSLELAIGKECEILKLTPDYSGVWDIISYYAEKLALLDNAINISLVNNKFAFMWGARNKTAASALKKMLDKINKGEPAVIYDTKLLNDPTDKDVPFQILERSHSLKEDYLTTDQLKDFQTILNNFDSEIGIPTIPYEKKERMVQSEADSRMIDSTARCTIWLECLQSSIKNIKKLYPEINLSVRLRYNPDEVGGDTDVKQQNDLNRS